MDFLRSSIKVLFHDISPADIMEIIDTNIDSNEFMDRIYELLTHRERTFSGRELEGLNEIIDREWLENYRELPSFRKHLYSCQERIFAILFRFGADTLNLHEFYPRVKFSNLLRWADLSRYVEENLLSIPYIAIHDLCFGKKRHAFNWPNVLRHDNRNINDILEAGTSDIHSHLYAATDVFDFNWIAAMNHPEIISSFCSEIVIDKKKNRDFLTSGRRLMYDGVARFSRYNFSLADWMLMAAYLRLNIYNNLIGECEIPWSIDTNDLRDLSSNPSILFNEVRALRSWLLSSGKGIKTSNGILFDYLISIETGANLVNKEQLISPFMVHHGERWLLYEFLTRYFGSNDTKLRKSAPYLWLYIIIRSKIRREFIQVSSLIGFDNFQRYQKRKSHFLTKINSEKLNEVAFCYGVQAALAENPNSFLEGRISSPQAKNMLKVNFSKSIFGNDETVLSVEDIKRFSFVIHFLKRKSHKHLSEGSARYDLLKKKYDKDMRNILRHQRWQTQAIELGVMKQTYPLFVGIDAASAEMGCRPEVFSEYYRRAEKEGIHNFTFHAGEDFFDILDGLRAIDETIFFLGFFRGCRIGHGLAMGTDPLKYYAERHGAMILPAQEFLDNLVWMENKANKLDVVLNRSTVAFIRSNIAKYLDLLHYDKVTDQEYWLALVHRCDTEDQLKKFPEKIRNIIDDYYKTPEVINSGNGIVHITDLPSHWAEDVAALQEAMLSDFEKNGIVIECNPTSNMRIGRFEKYIDHPVFKFHGVKYDRKHSIPITVNTDDSGVFATSHINEYSLIAAALYKEKDENGLRKYSDREIEEYIETLVKYGNRSRFRI